MGEYGMRLYYSLKELGYSGSCFGDIDERKSGYALGGLFCISYKEVCHLDKSQYVIVVAKKDPEKLVQDFKNQGFAEVYTDKELINILLKEAGTVKKHDQLDNLEEVQEALNWLKDVYYCNKELPQDKSNLNVDDSFKKELQQLLQDCIERKKYEYS